MGTSTMEDNLDNSNNLVSETSPARESSEKKIK